MPTEFVAQRYFDAIRDIWASFTPTHRIIPFCTPVFERPDAVVIGTNHSDFVDGGGELADRIADNLANGLPRESTFLVHNHKFARGLREVCHRAKIRIDENWVGTNRCPVQTGPGGLDEVKNDPRFLACQTKMDRILQDLLAQIVPRNIILVGKYAIPLYYPSAGTARIGSLNPHEITFPGADIQTRIIPIPHPSRATFWKPAADTLNEHYIK